MEIYNSEEEQLEAIKRWWQANGTAIIAGLVVGVIIIIGWNFWQHGKQNETLRASMLYQNLLQAAQASQADQAISLSEQILAEYPDSPYQTYARLFKARFMVEQNNLEQARNTLEHALDHTASEADEALVRLRLIEVLLAMDAFGDAAELLEDADPEAAGNPYHGPLLELKGDLHALQNQPAEAAEAYRQAMAAGVSPRFLQLKLDDVSTR